MISTICISLPTTYRYAKSEQVLEWTKTRLIAYGATHADCVHVLSRFKVFFCLWLLRSDANLLKVEKKVMNGGFGNFPEFSTWYLSHFGVKADVVIW